jgi:hypothetical protein
MGVTSFILKLICMMLQEYPVTKKETLGMAVASTLGGLAFTIWAGLCLFLK